MSFRSVSLCVYTTREYPSEYVYMFAVFMQNVKILLTAVKCLSCVKLLLCMICIQSLLQAHTHTHSLAFCVTIPLYITLSHPALKIQRTNAKTHYMICMHACRWFACSALSSLFSFSLTLASASILQSTSFFWLFSLSSFRCCCCCCRRCFFNLIFLYVIHQQRNGKPN